MRGIKQKCRLIVVALLKSDQDTITTTTEIGEHESITKAEKVLKWRKASLQPEEQRIIYSKITPIN
jgi:hypothetical protein